MELAAAVIRRFANKVLRLPSPKVATADATQAMPISRILVFGKFPNPTFDYYFAGRLNAAGMPNYELVDIRKFDSDTDAVGTYAIVVRYASFALARWIEKNKDVLAGVVVFVDDDIAAAIISREATWRYRYRLARQSLLPLRILDGLIDEVWVSTEALMRRLNYAKPRLLEPAPQAISSLTGRQPTIYPQPMTIAYHATAIHAEEHRFLVPVIEAVLEMRPSVLFEVVATGKSASLWNSLECERIRVKAPLPWEDYLRSLVEKIDIMVVPVAPSHLNDCRAETKRIDIARVGAAALLSDCAAFTPAECGEILVPYNQSAWIEALIQLIDNRGLREIAREATWSRVRQLSDRAASGIPTIKERIFADSTAAATRESSDRDGRMSEC